MLIVSLDVFFCLKICCGDSGTRKKCEKHMFSEIFRRRDTPGKSFSGSGRVFRHSFSEEKTCPVRVFRVARNHKTRLGKDPGALARTPGALARVYLKKA